MSTRIMAAFGLLSLLLSLTGCLTLNEGISSAVSAGTALVTTATGLPPVATVVAVGAADLAVGVVTEEVEALQNVAEIVNPWQAVVVAFNDLLNHAFEIVIAISIAVVGIPMVVSFVIGKVLPNRKTKEVLKENEVLKKLMEK